MYRITFVHLENSAKHNRRTLHAQSLTLSHSWSFIGLKTFERQLRIRPPVPQWTQWDVVSLKSLLWSFHVSALDFAFAKDTHQQLLSPMTSQEDRNRLGGFVAGLTGIMFQICCGVNQRWS